MWRPIFRKEIFEIFADSRTRLNVIVGPLLFTPLLLALIGTVSRSQADAAKLEEIEVGITGLQQAPSLARALNGADADRLKFLPLSSADEAERRIRDRKLRVALIVSRDAEKVLKRDETAQLTVMEDPGNEASSQAADRLKEFLRDRGARKAAGRLQARGLSTKLIEPFRIDERDVKGSSRSTLLLASFLPYVLSLSAIMGGLIAAANAVAGEKERGTLETLLVTPVSRRDIAVGKFLAVMVTSLISGTLSLIGLLWPFYIRLPMFSWMTSQGLQLKPAAIVTMVLVQLPLAVFGAGVLLALSTYAKNQKEMQGYAAPVMLLGTVGALLSLLLKADGPLIWALVPITNAALVLKQALQGIINPPFIAVACGTSVLYATASVLLAAHLFHRESILTRF